jgi:hypothetical protein
MSTAKGSKIIYFLLSFAALALGILFHEFSAGVLRNHGSDLLWALSGILAFRAIWFHWKYSWVPIFLALLWELAEIWQPNSTFDLVDRALYASLFILFQWLPKCNFVCSILCPCKFSKKKIVARSTDKKFHI